MRALLYPAFDELRIADVPQPLPEADEVLLRVAACGVCGSELESFKSRSPRRPPPLVMGHEFCGTIAAMGEGVAGWQVGDAVVSNSLVSCGDCVRCVRGDNHLCASRQIFGMHRPGAFAEFVAVPARCLLRWPEGVPAMAACLSEPLGNGVHMVALTRHLQPRQILVLGAGPIGLMALAAFRLLVGAEVHVADLSDERLEAARKLGAASTINPRSDDTVLHALDISGGEGVDLVIDAVGAKATKAQSLQAVRPGGGAVWIGLHDNALTLDSYDITLPEKQVLGTYGATLDDLQTALNLLAGGSIDLSWVQRFALEDGVSAFERMAAGRGGDIKAVIEPPQH